MCAVNTQLGEGTFTCQYGRTFWRIEDLTRSSASHICESLTRLCYHNFYLWTTLRLELLCARQQWPIVIGVLGC